MPCHPVETVDAEKLAPEQRDFFVELQWKFAMDKTKLDPKLFRWPNGKENYGRFIYIW